MKNKTFSVFRRLILICICFLSITALSTGNLSRVAVQHNGSELYEPLFIPPSNSTPRFLNSTKKETNPRVAAAVALNGGGISDNTRVNSLRRATRIDQPEGTCGPGMPCKNGACCRNDGLCGYCDEFCSAKVCLSNCEAQAECGRCAPSGQRECPLKVCCSEFGFCGTTADFCDLDKGCQTAFGGCGPPPKATCTLYTSKIRNIAYYESWATTRACDKVAPEDLDLTGLTHVNFAFAFFNPTTFEIAPMDANAGKLYSRFTNLKHQFTNLETWIAVGGWSFNDETNRPNTRTAFSDMASTSDNRKKFIDSLIKFMRTYGFDGADFDWEYPGADDRGGRPEDGDNFVQLVKEMKEAFGGSYGISVTLPASYWYLRHFKVKEMEPYIGWFNVMTYDIHGVWDSSNENVGPYARPHSNLTEIDNGLQLLWRASVKPENVVLGLGFYGRSFTLSDPSCNKPGCPFSAGGKPGKCSKASGVLTNAEIKRVINANDVTPMYDKAAAVKWITWNSNQWVSYDDETTLQQKRNYAEENCLGGTMIWAIDQDSADGDSMNDFLGTANAGIFAEDAVSAPLKLKKAIKETQQGMACYTSFCNTQCQKGFVAVTSARGQVPDFQFDTSCKGETFRDGGQFICCPSSALNSDDKPGKCEWRGYKGSGFACQRGCNDDEIEVAANSAVASQVTTPFGSFVQVAHTCTGGSQSYCCSNYDLTIMAGSPANVLQTNNYQAISAKELSTREIRARAAERGLWVLDGETIDPTDYGGSALSNSGAIEITELYSGASGLDFVAGYGTGRGQRQKAGASNLQGGGGRIQKPKPAKPKRPYKPKFDADGNRILGRYVKKEFDPKKDSDCFVTYTCNYGLGWDEVCDNQRYGVTEILGGRTSYNMKTPSISEQDRKQTTWSRDHHPNYHQWGTTIGQIDGTQRTRYYCEADEFPQNALQEAFGVDAPQAIREVDGIQNAAHGQDFYQWKGAVWTPCSRLRSVLGKAQPPVTWAFDMDSVDADDARLDNAAGFIAHYGFNSMDPPDRCFARFTAGGRGVTISDHGFRVDNGDTMFYPPLDWNNGNKQNWKRNPLTLGPLDLPTDVDSANYLRKRTLLPDVELHEALIEAHLWDSPPPPEPTHLDCPPSRIRRAMLQLDAASPASRPASSVPIQSGVVEKDEIKKENNQRGFSEWRNATIIDSDGAQ